MAPKQRNTIRPPLGSPFVHHWGPTGVHWGRTGVRWGPIGVRLGVALGSVRTHRGSGYIGSACDCAASTASRRAMAPKLSTRQRPWPQEAKANALATNAPWMMGGASQPALPVHVVDVNVGSFNMGMDQIMLSRRKHTDNLGRVVGTAFEMANLHLGLFCEVGGHKKGLRDSVTPVLKKQESTSVGYSTRTTSTRTASKPT